MTVDPYLPIISLAAVGRTEDQAVGTARELTELVKQSVYQLQVKYKVPAVEYITTQVIDEPSLISTQTNTNKRVIGGFGAAGHFLAFIDAAGVIEAAGPGFARLGLAQEALADMVREASERRPIVKRMLEGRRGALPVGLARLTDKRNLLVAIDENA